MLTNFSVYKPGNVKLHPELLGKHQKYVKDAIGAKEDKPVFLVFHGGSGSSKQEFLDAISYGVVKVNLDTDLQYAYLTGIRDCESTPYFVISPSPTINNRCTTVCNEQLLIANSCRCLEQEGLLDGPGR